MVNLRALANRTTSRINPNITIGLRVYQGFSIAGDGSMTPLYGDPIDIVGQVQALGKKDFEHLSALNISNCERMVYVNSQLQATDRLEGSGGDLLVFEGASWLIAAILEGWTTAGWCRAAVIRQMDQD